MIRRLESHAGLENTLSKASLSATAAKLERNEAVLLKCYDSKDDGRARFTAHTSFDDPNSPPKAAPRESIEVRALVFWPADQ
jgi:hypothetical protein